MKCEFEVTLTEPDVREVVARQSRPAIAVFVGLSLAIAAMFTMLAWPNWGWSALVPVIGMVAYLPFGARRMIQRLTRKQFRAIAEEQPMRICIDSDGVRVTSANSDSRRGWARFDRFLEGPHTLALRMKNSSYIVIPKRDLADVQLDELRSFLLSVVGKGPI
jgi:YcxB-like protein